MAKALICCIFMMKPVFTFLCDALKLQGDCDVTAVPRKLHANSQGPHSFLEGALQAACTSSRDCEIACVAEWVVKHVNS